MHFTWIHSFVVFGLKEHSRFQNLEHKDEVHSEAQHIGVETLGTELYPAATSLWMLRFQRRWFYLRVPPWCYSQAFLYRGYSPTHSVKMARMGCAGWKGRAPGCFLPWQAPWTPHILSAVPESPLWSPRWRYVLRGNIHLFLGSSLVPVGGNNPLSSPKSQLLVGKHAMLWCEHLWFGTIWWTQETLAWFNQYIAWKLIYESGLLCYTWKNPPAKTVSCPLNWGLF